MATDAVTVSSITGYQTTAGAAEETVNLAKNGAAPVASIPVPLGTTLFISDWDVCAPAAGIWRLQQTNNGSTFFDIGLAAVPGFGVSPTQSYSPRTGWVVSGGANVAFRVRVTTPGGASLVTTTIRSYTES
jgi:hypothetical protein